MRLGTRVTDMRVNRRQIFREKQGEAPQLYAARLRVCQAYPKTEIGIGWEAQKDLVGRAGRGYNRCGTNHNY
jgi:hypothetical protein